MRSRPWAQSWSAGAPTTTTSRASARSSGMERVSRRSRFARIACPAVGWLLALIVLPLHALELRVLSAGAVEPGIRPALAAFERETGHVVRIEFAAAPGLRAALRAPPAADVIVVP